MMDFSGHAGQTSDFDLLPKGLLVWANLNVRGLKTSATPSRYLDVELTVDQGQPYAGRKLWDVIGDPYFNGNTEGFRKMGTIAITRILECGGAGPNNPAGYQLPPAPEGYQALDGRRVAIKVGIEAGKDGHDDKNRVAEWLTPNPASQSGYKGFERLSKGDHGLQQPTGGGAANGFGGAAAAPAATGGFGNQGGHAAQQSGFGNGSGFGQPPAASAGQSGANGAETAAATQGNAPVSSPSSGQQTSGGWLEQANAPKQ
jgi:hypothetical protein